MKEGDERTAVFTVQAIKSYLSLCKFKMNKINSLRAPLLLKSQILGGRTLWETPLIRISQATSKSITRFHDVEWKIPDNAANRTVFFTRVHVIIDGKKSVATPFWYIRVFNSTTIKQARDLYHIGKEIYQGISVYTLDGGMSSEYAVEKSLAALDAGISHSWYTEHKGKVPRPIFSSPDFLKNHCIKP